MHLILRYPSGRLVDGILLAMGHDRMRIVVKRLNETMELRREEEQWISDLGDRVEIEGWLADNNQGMFDFLSRPARRTSTATH